MITHEQARECFNQLGMDTYDIDTETLNKYIIQQEKKDELLELYRDYKKVSLIPHMAYLELQTLNKIEELETELKEVSK